LDVKTKHKLGRLNNETTARILANPDTPVSVRAIVQALLSQKDVSKADEKNNSRPQKV